MKNHFLHLTMIIVLLVSGSTVAADGGRVQYNYGEFRFIFDSELDDTGIDGDGIAFGGSLRLDELFYVVADYETLDYDADIDVDILQIGLGLILNYQAADMVGELAILDGDADSGLVSYSDTGFRLSAGARTHIIPELEVRGLINHVDLDGTDTWFTVAADYFLSPSFSVTVSKDLSSELDRFSASLRYYFGE